MRRVSDATLFYAPHEVFSIGGSSGRDSGIISRFKDNFLKRNFRSILGLESPYHEFARTFGKAVALHRTCPASMIGTVVILELLRSQTIEGGLRLVILE